MSNEVGGCNGNISATDYLRNYSTSPENITHHIPKRTQDLTLKTRNKLIDSGFDRLPLQCNNISTKRSPNNRGKLHTLFEFQTMKPSEEYKLYQNAEVSLHFFFLLLL